MPRSPKGRAAARGLDARLSLQQAFMPAGDASLKQLRSIKMLIDSNHGIYRGENPAPGKDVHGELDRTPGIRERPRPNGDIGRPLNELVPEQLSCATLVLLHPEPRGRQ